MNENIVEVKKNKDTVTAIKTPRRVLPNLIEELLKNGIEVSLDEHGYRIGGFYGLNSVLMQDTDVEDVFVCNDQKGKKVIISSFKDLAILHKNVWSFFMKQPEYKKVNTIWFPHLLELDLLDIVPSK